MSNLVSKDYKLINKKRLKVGKFIEGSYFPSFDGASTKFSNMPRYIKQENIDIVIIHCYRGWSDLNLIKDLPFITYALPPNLYYKNHKVLLDILKKEKIEIIEFNDIETILSLGYHLGRKLNIAVTYDVHIISSELARHLSTKADYLVVKNLEKKVKYIISAASCFTVNDKNKLIKTTSINRDKVFEIPLGVDVKNIEFQKQVSNSNKILFLGNLFYEPNARAVEVLATIVFPMIKKEKIDLQFIIVGDAPKYLIDKYQNKDFKFVGRVKNLNSIFCKARIAVAPLDIGGGMRVKVLHYMAAGIPTILTSVAAEGIRSNSGLIIEDDFYKYAEQILKLMKDDYLKQKSIELRRAAENYYNWSFISKELRKYYLFSIKNKLTIMEDSLGRSAFEQPSWLKETVLKRRFNVAETLNKNTYLKLGEGKIEKFLA